MQRRPIGHTGQKNTAKMFADREDAGKRLAKALDDYAETDSVVLALPRGGAEVGYWVSKRLGLDFSLLISRKLPMPDNPETGWGAIAEDGSMVLMDYAGYIPAQTKNIIIEEQQDEIERRIQKLRGAKALPRIAKRTVILVDDGIATGSTVMAAINMCKNLMAKKIVIASPVAGPDTIRALEDRVDDIVVLEQPLNFRAVAQAYENWYDVSDEEVIDIMHKWEEEHKGP